MLCYRCGSHVPDGSATCPTCGQSLASGGLRQATGTFSRRKLASSSVEGAPYKPGDVISGRFTVRDVVGQGPVGYVFRAHDKEIDVEVALKTISPRLLQTLDERRAFARELKGARKLNHNNICRVYDEGEHQDRPYYTTQFLDGLSLRKIIDLRKEKAQFFRLDEVEPILAQIAQALDEAHRAGIVHGDLKPENVLVLPDLLKVTDFALGMAMPRLPFVNAQKARKADRYAAPEFVSGGEVSSAADIYALGAILGEMLCGALPDGSDLPELRALNPAVTPQAEALYRRALNGNPAARFTRASALAAEVALLAGGGESESEATVPMPRRALETAVTQKPPPMPRPPTNPARPSTGKRPPPPPVIAPASTGEIDVTPTVDRPPPPVAAVTDELPRPLPPPLPDPQKAISTKVELPSAPPESRQEEPTQVINTAPLLAAAEKPPPPVMPIARPLPKQKSSLFVPLMILAGLVAGGGVGWLVLRYQAAERARIEQKRIEAEKLAQAEAEDAGHWAVILAKQQTQPQDAGGPDVKLAAIPPDAGTQLAMVTGTTGSTPHTQVDPTPQAAGSGDCPAGMIEIAAGDYLRGYKSGDPLAGWDEVPLSKSHTDAYCIDMYEFPNQAGARPQINVSYTDAKAACESQGKRLCTEDEWERACKGPKNARFTWGDSFQKDACNLSKSETASGDHPDCKSAFGVYDLSGNLAEWTSTRYAPGISGKAIKGATGEAYARCAGRRPANESHKESVLGFRCCRNAG